MGGKGTMALGRAKANIGEPAGWKSSELVSDVAVCVLVGVAYFVVARLSLRFSLVERNITPLWPPTGLALVAFLRSGRRMWPGIAVAAFLVNEPITPTLLAAGVTAAGNTIAPVLAATLLIRTGFRQEMDRVRDVAALVILGALLPMIVSATIGTGTLVVSDSIGRDQFLSSWSVWWAGDAMGVLVVAPFLLVLVRPSPFPRSLRRWHAEALGLFAALALASIFAAHSDPSTLFLLPPLAGWAAWRFQQRGAAPAALLASFVITWAAVRGIGPFHETPLLQKMLTLQAFNATVAFTAFFLAALVLERIRSHEALELAAADLEIRVERRTRELSEANDRLAREIGERRHAEDHLQRSELLLSGAQEVAHLGSWEWDIPSGRIAWSDEMFRIHGHEPGSFTVTLDRAIGFVAEEDQDAIRADIETAIREHREILPGRDYTIMRPDGESRALHGRGRLSFGPDGTPARMVGTVQDMTQHHEYEREHRIADTLQRALLPQGLPTIDGFVCAARYVPAEAGIAAGGDWYDVVPLRNGSFAVVIGDVSGHGLEAASLMGQLRLAVRAYAVEGHPPATTVALADALIRRLGTEQIATLLYMVIDPIALDVQLVSAGHPPALVLPPNGAAFFLDRKPSPPLGWGGSGLHREEQAQLEPGTTLILYTDGLIDRRDLPIDEGLERLRSVAQEARHEAPDTLLERIVTELVSPDVEDDIAMVALRPLPVPAGPLELRIAAQPQRLFAVRRSLARWLAVSGVDADVAADILLACGEACSNAIQHAYGPGDGSVEIDAQLDDGTLELSVRDFGRWSDRTSGRGRGLKMIEACVDTVTVEQDESGTRVRMRRRVRTPVST
jgi:integral membrane sensor domain MASE1/anti-sigma regulatory factor (Ser/Thr protein kinase)